ncbi:MAG: excinuclease ABC subunit C [Bacteroidales bacterium]|nr:excinuclease ABC subunit C [Bacteroidales bacterium]
MQPESSHTSLSEQVQALPGTPGVYLFLDKEDKVIYVGKAKNLRKRVSSYFSGRVEGKTRVLVGRIANIDHVVVESESDALLLENNLIKKYQPRYNILLKDDKSYPWIVIKNEHFPRVFMTRNVVRDRSEYFGPYTSVRMVHTLLDLIRQLYPLRTCKLNLNPENIAAGKYKECLEYHLGKCMAPCVGKQTEEEYSRDIQSVRMILKGHIREVTLHLKSLMEEYARNLLFEKAQVIKEKLEVLEKYRARSVVVTPKIREADVFSVIDREKFAVINFLKIVNGAVVQSHTIEVKKVLGERKEDILPLIVSDIRQRFSSNSLETIVAFRPGEKVAGTKWTVPLRGDKKKLLELSERNAKYYVLEKEKREERFLKKHSTERRLEQLRKDLRLQELPRHIECFDNSNLQGTHPVASCVVFRDARPSKKDYRHFNIKTVRGPDDYASMEEVVNRRYKRLIEKGKELPQLVVIDGGKGQLNAALKSLAKLGLEKKIVLIGIAKRLEEIYFPHDPVPLYLDKNSESLKIIQQLRDEAHRFGITFHRKKRSQDLLRSEMDGIPGIGPKTTKKLLEHFGSVARIKAQNPGALEAVIGKAKAKVLRRELRRKDKEEDDLRAGNIG